MKKIIFILLYIAITFQGIAQLFPPNPPPDSPNVPKVNQRGSMSIINDDARLMAQFNFFPPRYTDTAHANIPNYLGADTCGALIFTYDINNFWVRACSPKRWVRVASDQILPDGVYSGGDFIYSGVGYDYIATAATYVLNHVIYNTPQGIVTLDPSDATFGRIDVLGLGINGPGKITGIPSSNPQELSANPLTFIRRSIVQVAANSVTPAAVVQLLIYDQGTGSPGEWNPTSAPFVDYFDLDLPYHLTISALVTGITSSDRMQLVNTDTLNTSGKNSLIAFVRLGVAFPADVDLNFQLMYQGNPVTALIPFSTHGFNRGQIGFYQGIAVPFPEFGPSTIVFDEVDIVPTGASEIPAWRVDYIQIQSGLLPVYSGQNAFTSVTADLNPYPVIATSPNSTFKIKGTDVLDVTTAQDNTITFVTNRLIRNDTWFGETQGNSGIDVSQYININRGSTANNIFSVTGSRGSIALGQFIDINTNGNGPIGGYFIHPITRFLASNMVDGHAASLYLGKSYSTDGNMVMQYVQKSIASGGKGVAFTITPFGRDDIEFWFYGDSSFVIGNHDIKNDRYKLDVPNGRARFNGAEIVSYTAQGARINDSTYLWYAAVDSMINRAVAAGAGLPNLGSGYRVLLPSTGYKTLFVTNGVQVDSSSNTNGLTFQVDSLSYTTRLRTQKIADSLVSVISSGNRNVNIGSFYRWTVPGTNNVKTLAVTNGILADSSSNTNALTIQADTAVTSTKLFTYHIVDSLVAIIATANNNANVGAGVGLAIAATRNIRSIVAGANITIDASNPNQITIASSAGAPGTLTSFGFTPANGFTGSVATSTTTPNLIIGTSVTANQVVYSTGTAIAGSAAFLFNPSNQRVSIGASASATAYLNLNPSTITQASLNLGNAGVNPTTPNNGDVWLNANHILARLGGLTFQIDQQTPTITVNSTPLASGTAGRLLFQSAANLVSQSANIFWDNVNNRLRLNGANVAAALSLPASTTAQAPINLGNAGTAPTAPNNADLWVAANHLNVRLNGATFQLDQQTLALTVNSSSVAAGTPGRIFFQNAANQLSQSAGLFWNTTSSALQINGAATVAALSLPASTTGQASINFGNGGVAPTTPVNGDAWVTGNNIFVRLNGVSVQLNNPAGAGVQQAIGTANQVNVSSPTGIVTFSLPQSIAVTSAVQFQRLTVGGANALPSLVITAATDPTATAGVFVNNGTRAAISFVNVFKRFVVTNDIAPPNGSVPIGNGVDYTNAILASANNNLVTAVGAGTWSIRPNSTFQTLTDAASVTWNANNGYNAIWNAGGIGRTLAISNSVNGTTYVLKLINTTGTATVTTWPAGTIWPSGTPPALPAVAGAIMMISLTFDGTNYTGVYNPNRFQ